MRWIPLMLAWTIPLAAIADPPPPTTDDDRVAAETIARMEDDSPQDRLVRMLQARDLSEGALFLLAGADPVLVDEVLDEKIAAVLAWVAVLPATRMSDLRAGQTVVRNAETWSDLERQRLEAIADLYGLKARSLTAVRIGTVGGATLRFEMIGRKDSREVTLAIPPAPTREERARDRLATRFHARPAEITSGPGTRVPLEDASFEDRDLARHWQIATLVEKGNPLPAAEVTMDPDVAMDGRASLRFHADARTRSWPQVSQVVTIAPGTSLVLRGHIRTRFVRKERDQERIFQFALVWLDISGAPVGRPVEAEVPTGDMDWREFVVRGVAPADTAYVQVAMACTMSGTAWFDGLQLEIGY
ncbi:MAG: hypothetical protein JXB39_09675 [Deltaproteobacteria bacterium]|nr:hypothetical protein [Deltaproteobacteria bacterium]